jgi:hypothetical protein
MCDSAVSDVLGGAIFVRFGHQVMIRVQCSIKQRYAGYPICRSHDRRNMPMRPNACSDRWVQVAGRTGDLVHGGKQEVVSEPIRLCRHPGVTPTGRVGSAMSVSL